MRQTPVETRPRKARLVQQRRSLFPNTIVLLLAIVALLLFIGMMGDARRKRNALHQAEIYAAAYAERAAQTKALPLNLEPNALGSAEPKWMNFRWLPSEHVHILRQADQPVLAAWSEPIIKFFGRDGRTAIFFHAGVFEVKWLSPEEFEQAEAAQAALIERLNTQPMH